MWPLEVGLTKQNSAQQVTQKLIFQATNIFRRATNTRIGFPWNFVANISNCYNFRLESDKSSCLLKQLFGLLKISNVDLMKLFTPFNRDILPSKFDPIALPSMLFYPLLIGTCDFHPFLCWHFIFKNRSSKLAFLPLLIGTDHPQISSTKCAYFYPF